MNPVDHPHGGGNHQAVHGPNSVPRTAHQGRKSGTSRLVELVVEG